MDVNFWLQRWENNEIGFHEKKANPLLVTHFKKLLLNNNSRVFLPLCGKTLDIAWLLSKGFRVAGAELSKTAIEQLFVDLGVEPNISTIGNIDRYSAENLDIFVGDIFELSRDVLGPIDATYDRAALVALPEKMRRQYTSHLLELTCEAPQLLLSYAYDQNVMDGPPFSVSHDEVKQHYIESYTLDLLRTLDVSGGLKGKCAATESIWLLTKS